MRLNLTKLKAIKRALDRMAELCGVAPPETRVTLQDPMLYNVVDDLLYYMESEDPFQYQTLIDKACYAHERIEGEDVTDRAYILTLLTMLLVRLSDDDVKPAAKPVEDKRQVYSFQAVGVLRLSVRAENLKEAVRLVRSGLEYDEELRDYFVHPELLMPAGNRILGGEELTAFSDIGTPEAEMLANDISLEEAR